MDRSRHPSPERAAPFFIVGANRSGTTLLRLILNAHSRLAVPEEVVYFDSQIAGVPVERWRRPGLSSSDYAAFVRRFVHGCSRSLDGLDAASLIAEILEEGPPDFRRPYRAVLERWAERHGKARWGEKTPGNLFYADVIAEMFPQARFVHMVRDPRAVVSSMQRVSFFPDDVAFNALTWRKHLTEGRALLEEHVPPARRLTLRYEYLVTDPEQAVRAVCDLLGERFEPAMLRFHETAGAYMKPSAASGFNEAATTPISSEGVDKWKRRLSREERAVVDRLCAPQMRAFGYEPAGEGCLSWATRLGMLARGTYWAWQTWRHRHVRHYTVRHRMFARSRERANKLLRSIGARRS
jgi:hypothetical protein